MRGKGQAFWGLVLVAACGTTSHVVPPPSVQPILPSPLRPVEPPADPGALLEILTYNCWGLPGFLGTDKKLRMRQIASAIRPYQIVALQETFTKHAEIIEQESGFPYWHRHNNKGLIKIGSGLFTLSRLPILETDFREFTQTAGWDSLSHKGVLFTRLLIPGQGEVDVYNTHYQAEDKEHLVRMDDNRVLAELVRHHDRGNPTIIMGDFNMEPTFPEYGDLLRRLPLVDAYARQHQGDPGYSWDPANSRVPDKDPPQRLDYIFLLKQPGVEVEGGGVELVMTSPQQGGHLSDHFGLKGRFRFRRGAISLFRFGLGQG